MSHDTTSVAPPGPKVGECAWCRERVIIDIAPSFMGNYFHYGCFDAWGKHGGTPEGLVARKTALDIFPFHFKPKQK